jgi:predicted permease
LGRSPGFTGSAVLTLAIGVGACVAIFALVDGVLLKALPYPEPDHLVTLRHAARADRDGAVAGAAHGAVEAVEISDGLYEHYRTRGRAFEEIAIWQTAFVNLDGPDGDVERVELVMATPSLLPLLGVRPALGAGFDERDVGGVAVLLSHGLWLRRYGGDPDAVGRTTWVNGAPRRIAGVMPPDFRFPDADVDLWMDLGLPRSNMRVGAFYYRGAARLRPGVTVEAAEQELARLLASVEGEFPDATPGRLAALQLDARVAPMKDDLVRDVRGTLGLLAGTVAFVLLIAGANVANLTLVRATGKRHEVTVRAAIGAGRLDLVRHLLAESALVALIGGAIGTLAAAFAVEAFARGAPVELPRLHELSVDGRTLAFAAALSVTAALVFGLVAAVHALRVGERGSLAPASRSRSAGPERQRAQRLLVAGQVALALTLLIGSALMVQTSVALARVDKGFDSEDVWTFEIAQPHHGYETYELSARFQLDLLDSLRALPGVESAGAVSGLPMTATEGGASWTAASRFQYPIEVEGQPSLVGEERMVRMRLVTDGYFETMRIRIQEGRAPTAADRASGESPVLVGARLAETLFPGVSAVGRRVRHPNAEAWSTIVGVVADVRDDGSAAPPPEILWVPVLDELSYVGAYPGHLAFAVRSGLPPGILVREVRRIVGRLDSRMPIAGVRTMEDIVQAKAARTTFTTSLLLLAGAAAAFLGTVGIYGILSYAVGLRRREIGVRIALGARAGDVAGMVVRDGTATAGAGLAAGLVAAALLTRFMEESLYGVSPTDPLTFAGTAAGLLGVAMVASALPARRAARVDPVEALASE